MPPPTDPAPPPPRFDDDRTGPVAYPSSGPVSAQGISWPAAGAVLVVLLGLAVSWGTLNAKLDSVLNEVRTTRQTVTEHGEWIAEAKVRIGSAEDDIDDLEGELPHHGVER